MTALTFDAYWRDRGITRGITNTGRQVDQLGRKFDGLNRTGTSFGDKMRHAGLVATGGVGLVAGAVLGIGKAFTSFASFDKTMRQVGIQTGETGRGLENLSDLALKMGKDTSFSAREASDAMLELSKSGMTSAQIRGGALKQTLTLAAAGGVDLATAATTMSGALNTFGLRAKDSARVAAALAGGANASSASVEDLALALQQVGPGAKQAGLDVNETVAALSMFANAGIRGSDAGTSLKVMLQRLVPQTDKAASMMEKLGIDFTNADGSFKSLDQIAGILSKSMKGLSEEQRTAALNTIFGSDASRAAAILMENGEKKTRKYVKATKDRAAAEKLAKSNTEGAAGAIEQLMGSAETFGISMGKLLAPGITAAARFGTRVLNKLTDMAQGVPDALSGVGDAVREFFDRFKFPIARLKFTGNWGSFGKDVGHEIGSAIIDGIKSLFKGGGRLADAMADIDWVDVGKKVGGKALGFAIGFISGLGEELFDPSFWKNHWWDVLVAALSVAGVGKLAGGLAKVFAKIPVLRSIAPLLRKIDGLTGPFQKAVGGVIRWGIIRPFRALGGAVMRGLRRGLGLEAGDIGAWIVKKVTGWLWPFARFGGWVRRALERGRNRIVGWFEGLGERIGRWIGKTGKRLRTGGRELIDGLKTGMVTKFAEIRAWVSNAIDRIRHPFRTARSWLPPRGQQIISGLSAGLRRKWTDVTNWLGGLKAKVTGKFSGAAGWLVSAGRNVIAGLISGLTGKVGELYEKARGIAESVKGIIARAFETQSPSRWARRIGRFIGQGLRLGMDDVNKLVADAAERLASSSRSRFRRIVDDERRHLGRMLANREHLAKRIGNARKRLDEALKVRNEFRESVKDTMMGFGSIMNLESEIEDPRDIASQLQSRLNVMRQFSSHIRKLEALGLNKRSLREILEAGPEAGGRMAEGLVAGGANAIRQVNRIQRDMSAVSHSLGVNTSKHFHQAGVQAALGIVRGLESQDRRMRRSVRRLVRELVREVRRGLRISSPSRVMEQLGGYTGEGFARGIERSGRRVNDAMAQLAKSPGHRAGPVRPVTIRRHRGTGGEQVVRVVVDVQGGPAEFQRMIRKWIRTENLLQGARA